MVAIGVLHEMDEPGSRRKAEVQVIVGSDHRGQGIARTVVGELIKAARGLGLKELVCHLVLDSDQREARAAEIAGLLRLTVLPDGMTILELPRGRWQ